MTIYDRVLWMLIGMAVLIGVFLAGLYTSGGSLLPL